MIPRRLPLRPLGHQGILRGSLGLRVARTRHLQRRESTTSGASSKNEVDIQDDEKSGHISAAPNESILFFDSKIAQRLQSYTKG